MAEEPPVFFVKPPRISICLPNLNTRPFLEERMESILAQTLTDWELIICDSYSQDGSWEFFQKFAGDPRIRMYQVPREGVYAGWNECLRRARGEYIYIATSDDGAQPDLLEKLSAPLEQFKEVHLACCDFQPVDERGQPAELRAVRPVRQFFGDWLHHAHRRSGHTELLLMLTLGSTWFTENTILFRRSLLQQAGFFVTHLGPSADRIWNMRVCLETDIVFVPGRLASWRMHSQQATPQRIGLPDTSLGIRCVRHALDLCAAKLPPHWKHRPDWHQKLCQVPQTEYLDSYNLYRGEALRRPGEFVRNILRALRREPAFLLAQAGHGFRWDAKFSPDRLQAARDLIELFQSPWPPTAVPLTAPQPVQADPLSYE